MVEFEYPSVEVAASVILDRPKHKLLWVWNRKWRVFALPVLR